MAHPLAGLVQGSDGNFYGTTESGGTSNLGTVFKISTNAVLTRLHLFTGTNDGANPIAALVPARDGSFYGTTASGPGQSNAGTIFRLTLLPEPPQLTITPSADNLILTWPTNSTGLSLQSAPNLGPSVVWTTSSWTPVVVNGLNTITNPVAGTQQFFRLTQ